MAGYQTLKSMYRTLLPSALRTFLWKSPLTRRPREWMLRRAEQFARHEEIYDRAYFEKAVDPTAAVSAPVMVRSMIAIVHPKSVIDVGCGTGQILMAFGKQGVSGRGLEYSEAALEICRERGLDVQKFDLEQEQSIAWRSDLVVSTEVAEHLPASCADRYVDLLCRMSDKVVITAAVPGATGTDHVNEQPNSYWIEKFSARSFDYDEAQSMKWRDEWKSGGAMEWYCASAMLFRKRIAAPDA